MAAGTTVPLVIRLILLWPVGRCVNVSQQEHLEYCVGCSSPPCGQVPDTQLKVGSGHQLLSLAPSIPYLLGGRSSRWQHRVEGAAHLTAGRKQRKKKLNMVLKVSPPLIQFTSGIGFGFLSSLAHIYPTRPSQQRPVEATETLARRHTYSRSFRGSSSEVGRARIGKLDR